MKKKTREEYKIDLHKAQLYFIIKERDRIKHEKEKDRKNEDKKQVR